MVLNEATVYTDEDLNPHAFGVLFISFKGVKYTTV